MTSDSIGKETRIRYICSHHEQASAMAAEAYARISGRPGVVNVTTGPGRQLPDGRIVSPNLEDMYPFLDPTELMDNVILE